MKGWIAWFARNPVAANLLMVLILAAGVFSMHRVRQELLPEVTPRTITVSVPYPGAGPEEVEEAVCVKIEEAVYGTEGVRQITSTASEGIGTVTLELENDADPDEVLNEIKTRVDAIDTFPDEAEKPVIRKLELRRHVVNVAVYGDTDEKTLKRITERVRDDLASLPGITHVTPASVRTDEISIEVSERTLRKYDLTFDQVVRAVRRASVDLPGGRIKTEGGEILLRTDSRAESVKAFESLPLRTTADGARLLLGDVATIVDGFEDTDLRMRFDGKPAMLLQVWRVGDQNILDIADAVNEYVRTARDRLPEGIFLATSSDNSRLLRGRLDLLLRNGRFGLILVLLVLVLLFRLRLAFWVAAGLVVSFMGAIAFLPVMGVTINLVSLFGFIICLGILVDDAIVISENIYRHNQEGRTGVQGAVAGTLEVAQPVILAVLTTIAAFVPMLWIPGRMGDFASVIPKVVILALGFSLAEALLILPAHLSHLRPGGRGRRSEDDPPGEGRAGNRNGEYAGLLGGWRRFQDGLSGGLERFVHRFYRPVLQAAIRWRYLTLAAGLAMLLLTFGLLRGGWIKFVFFPPIEADVVSVSVEMPEGTPAYVTDRVVRRIERAAMRLRREFEGERPGTVIRHVSAAVGTSPFRGQRGMQVRTFQGANIGEVALELVPGEEREISARSIMKRWRELVGPVPDAALTYSSDILRGGNPIDIRLSHASLQVLRRAAAELKRKLRDYRGVFDITDSHKEGKRELRLTLRPAAEAAGLSEIDLARQVRSAFYGAEVQRFTRNREEVKVMVRLPEADRRTLDGIETLRIRGEAGTEIPFAAVARIRWGRGPARIQRADRNRSIHVTADVDENEANANEILADLRSGFLPQLVTEFPGLRFDLEGEQREQRETLGGIFRGSLLVLLLIYTMLAVLFRSYLQPVLIMLAIPFGIAGAVWAHFFLGMPLTLMSMIGIMALTGLVVNDSLILIDFVNHRRKESDPEEAVLAAGPLRFRPILITTLTTFAGLTPMLLERSLQAQFLIPMAVSLAYGVAFATVITLLIVPAAYLVLEDVLRRVRGR